MNQSSSSSTFQTLFNAALRDYQVQTGTRLVDHPFARQIQECDSLISINSILEEQAKVFFRLGGCDGKLIRSLNCSVDILYTLSISTVLGEGVGVPFPPAKAIFAGIAILLAAVKDIGASYDALVELFASFETFLGRLSIYTEIPSMPALTDVLVKIIVELLSTLALATKQVKQGRFKKFVKKLRGEKDIEATIQRLDRLTMDEVRVTAAQTLEVVHGLVQHRKAIMNDADENESTAVISHALKSMQEIVRKMKKEERDKIQQEVQRWLSPPDPWKNHNLARKFRHSGTGTWWIQGETYAEWKSSGHSSLLWIHGKPGAGKSVICSLIIEDIRTLQKSGLASLAFFYYDFRDDQKKDVRGLLSSLLVQLGDQSDAYSAILSEFYGTHRRGFQHASDGELRECLEEMLMFPGQAPVHIIIDAVDECPITEGLPSPREDVLKLVEELVNLRIPNLRICITSRPEADIVLVLAPLAFCSVCLHGESGQVQDIAKYVKSFVHEDSRMRRWKATEKQLVIEMLIKKADGMFRWVFFQLAHLRRCFPGRILRALDELPETLDETYARNLKEIDNQNWKYAHRLFQCVAAASRPLRVEELAEVLAFDFEAGPIPTFLADWRPEDPTHIVLSTCSSFLAVVDVDGSHFIQFTHFSVKEYLTSDRLAATRDSISRYHVSMTSAHTTLAQACLGVLLHLDESITGASLEYFPLSKYASRHWVDHARFGNVASIVHDGIKRLFDPSKSHLSVWTWIYDPEDNQSRYLHSKPSIKTRATPLHYAAFCGMHDVATFLIVEHSQDVNARAFDMSETPLHVASRRGHVKLTRVLLEHGADTEARNRVKESPLLLASRKGHVELIRDLLKHNANTETRGFSGYNALGWAIYKDHVEVARVLIEYGADFKAQDGNQNTPLYWALEWGKTAAAQELIKHGADVKALGKNNQTLLHRAKGEEAARLLLKHGADPNALDTKNRTPLHLASEYGRVGVARILLENGANPNARDFSNATPLHLAANSGTPPLDEISQLLLKNGSDVHALDDKSQTLFIRASDVHAWHKKHQSRLMRATAKAHVRDCAVTVEKHGAEDRRK